MQDVRGNLEVAGEAENIIFWTKTQKALNQDTDANRLINWNEREKKVWFSSEFGTGKTTLLRHKAKQLAQKCPQSKVYFVALPQSRFMADESHLIVYLDTIAFFEREKVENVVVCNWKDIEDEFSLPMNQGQEMKAVENFLLAKMDGAAGFFIDEFCTKFFYHPKADLFEKLISG